MARQIQSSRLLLVEGKEDFQVCEEIKKHMLSNLRGYQEVNSIQVWDYEGIDKLENTLKYIITTREYNNLHSIGIIADADNGATQRFKKIQGCIGRCGCSAPNDQLSPTLNNPSIIVLVVPRNGEGMIEKLCLDSVSDDPAMECVNRYFNCLQTVLEEDSLPRNSYKSKLQAFLVSRKNPGLTMGYAAMKKYFPFENEAFGDIKEMMALMVGQTFYNV